MSLNRIVGASMGAFVLLTMPISFAHAQSVDLEVRSDFSSDDDYQDLSDLVFVPEGAAAPPPHFKFTFVAPFTHTTNAGAVGGDEVETTYFGPTAKLAYQREVRDGWTVRADVGLVGSYYNEFPRTFDEVAPSGGVGIDFALDRTTYAARYAVTGSYDGDFDEYNRTRRRTSFTLTHKVGGDTPQLAPTSVELELYHEDSDVATARSRGARLELNHRLSWTTFGAEWRVRQRIIYAEYTAGANDGREDTRLQTLFGPTWTIPETRWRFGLEFDYARNFSNREASRSERFQISPRFAYVHEF